MAIRNSSGPPAGSRTRSLPASALTGTFRPSSPINPIPQVRITHALLDALTELVEANNILPAEIERIHAWGEGWVMLPTFLSRSIEDVHDAQFSMAHGLAVGAHRLTPGKEWQDPAVVFSPSVLGLMEKVTIEPHQGFVSAISAHPAARPSRIEVTARGTTFTAEREYVKGSPSPDPRTYFTDEELVAKFRHNAEGVLESSAVDAVVESVFGLELVHDVSALTRLLASR